ncbi:MAG: tetratricopeptide repeat protein [Planctomycetaceae bacterium]
MIRRTLRRLLLLSRRTMPAWLVVSTTLTAAAIVARSVAAQPPASQPATASQRLTDEGKAAIDKGDFQTAIERTSEALRQNPQDDLAYYYRGSARIELGLAQGNADLVRTGIADAREAITRGGRTHKTYYLPYLYGMTALAALEDRREHAETALQVADQTLAVAGLSQEDRGTLLYQRGRVHGYLGDHDKAARDFTQSIQAAPKLMASHLELAGAYAAAGQDQQVLDTYRNALQVFGEDAYVYNDRGMYYRSQGKAAEAVADFTRAFERNSNFQQALINRGMTLLENGQPAAAESDFTAYARLAPGQPMAHGMLGASQMAQGKLDPAIASYRRALEINPRGPEARADLGFARFFQKDYAAAATEFTQARTLNPQMIWLDPWLYWSLRMTGKDQEASRLFADKLGAEADARLWPVQLLRFLSGQTEPDALLEAARRGQEQGRTDRECEAHYWIGRRLAAAGQTQQAQAAFRQSLASRTAHLSTYRGAQFELNEFPTQR